MKLALTVANPRVTTLEAFQVGLTLENDGPAPVTIPGAYDQTHALTLEARRPDGSLFVAMNGLTRQALMTRGRLDMTPLLETLDPGTSWTWDLDLARYHYPLPAGSYRIEAVYRHEAAGPEVRSASVTVEVEAARLTGVHVLEDSPVLDGLTLLLHAVASEGPITVLRQHNAPRPLAAWYSAVIEGARAPSPLRPAVAWGGPVAPFLAAARYRTNESFDPSFLKWLISTDGQEVRAHCFEWGQPDPTAGTAPVPPGLSLLNCASYDGDNRLLLAFRRPDGALEIHEMHPGQLVRQFELPLPPTPLPPVVRWDCDGLHVVTPHAGALYHRLTPAGVVEREVQLVSSPLPVVACDIDPFRRRVRLLAFDPTAGERRRPAIEMTVIGPEPEDVARARLDDPLPEARWTELSFDTDAAGGFHLLAATDGGALHYLRPDEAPVLVAEGEERWWPVVRTARGVQLGYYLGRTGYRFQAFRHGRPVDVPGSAEAGS